MLTSAPDGSADFGPVSLVVQWLIRCAIALTVAALAGCATQPPHAASDWDLSVGDDRTGVLHVRASGPAAGTLHLVGPDGTRQTITPRKAGRDGSNATRFALSDVAPGTRYTLYYGPADAPALGVRADILTPRASTDATPITLQFGGDLGGQNACRDARRGYAVLDAAAARPADAFIALGDMIYADGTCGVDGPFGNAQIPGPTEALAGAGAFAARWRYNLADPAFRRLRHSRLYLATWDDHEIVNDFGPQTAREPDNPGRDLLAAGRDAFIDHAPLPRAPDDPGRIYRKVRFGAHAEVFLLDTRQYRDRNDLNDTGVLPKSLLGAAQRRWLIEGVTASTATWKFIASSVPISIPTGWPPEAGRDGWASGDGDDGFERELYAIFEALGQASVRNLVWLTADVHFATGFALQPLPERPDFVAHEWVVGPLSAGLYPTDAVDPTFRPQRRYLHAPDSPPQTLHDALRFYNFGELRIAASGTLTLSVVNGHGDTVAQQRLTPD